MGMAIVLIAAHEGTKVEGTSTYYRISLLIWKGKYLFIGPPHEYLY